MKMDFIGTDPKNALKLMPLPVVIVSARKGEEINGMTAAWISQVSAEPPVIMVAIRSERYTWEMMKDTENFGVSVLGEGQEKIAGLFGSVSGRNRNKFKEGNIEPIVSDDGIALIPGSVAAFVCRKTEVVSIGDHLAVFGEILKSWKGEEKDPLVWYEWKISKLGSGSRSE